MEEKRFEIETDERFKETFGKLLGAFGLDVSNNLWPNDMEKEHFVILANNITMLGSEKGNFYCTVRDLETKREYSYQFNYYGLLKYLFLIYYSKVFVEKPLFFTFYNFLIEVEKQEKSAQLPVWEFSRKEVDQYVEANIISAGIDGMSTRMRMLNEMQEFMVNFAHIHNQDNVKGSPWRPKDIGKYVNEAKSRVTARLQLEDIYELAKIADDMQSVVVPLLIFEGVRFTIGAKNDELIFIKKTDINEDDRTISIKGRGKSPLNRIIKLTEKSFEIVKAALLQNTSISWDYFSMEFTDSPLLDSPYLLRSSHTPRFNEENKPVSSAMITSRIREMRELVKEIGVVEFTGSSIAEDGKIFYIKKFLKETDDIKKAIIMTLKRFGEWNYDHLGEASFELTNDGNKTRFFRMKRKWDAKMQEDES
ncbi:site-specific integrase [Enterococcus timonensis]|uniref:site-specific integrase n=1 Tax=Enterococcus timonensis TaxID=1852364 RepID=UPI0008D99984|nr:site-specific integrase [Enterococcus timonensis]